MKAVGYKTPGAISRADALEDITLPRPQATGRDILVEVKAVSVNPVDTKIRASAQPSDGAHRVLGWNAAGVVAETGPEVSLFRPGDTVWYAGSIVRPGTNSQFHLVDERLAARKPDNLAFADAAAMPLTAITAWEPCLTALLSASVFREPPMPS